MTNWSEHSVHVDHLSTLGAGCEPDAFTSSVPSPPARAKHPTHCEKVLALLSDGKPHNHHEGYALGLILHSRVSDLRRKGHVIRSWRDGDDYMYQLESTGPARRGASPTQLVLGVTL